MRLIDADALKEEFKKPFWEKWEWEFICKCIDNAPTVKAFTVDEVEEIRQTTMEQVRISCKQNERPQGEWGKWVISEIRCPKCLEYFQTDCYSMEELNKCPSCGADMQKVGGES